MLLVPKILGFDSELSNSLLIPGQSDGRNSDAARRLLREIPGYPLRRSESGTQFESGRRFLDTNAGSIYEDCSHLEINLAERTEAFAQPAALHGMLRVVREAQVAASRELPAGVRLSVLANTGDGGHESFGSHVNVLVSRRCFENVLGRQPHLASVLATHLVTSVIYTGQGQVGASNGRESCDFQLSQRADWFEQFFSLQTTHNRGLLNLRDESLCGQRSDLARMHVIYLDQCLAPVATILKFGTLQLVLAMLEAGWLDAALSLDDPLAAASAISRDLELSQRWPLAVRGRSLTAVEVQAALAERAGEFVASGMADEVIPNARRIVDLWIETIDCLRQRDREALAQRSDAWLKLVLLERYRGRKGLTWQSSQMKLLDLLFASLDPEEGQFFQMAEAGLLLLMPTDAEIDLAQFEPPTDTRAYFRAHVLRRFGHYVTHIDWDRIQFAVQQNRYWSSTATLWMSDPCGFSQPVADALLARCSTLAELIDAVHEPSVATAAVPPLSSTL